MSATQTRTRKVFKARATARSGHDRWFYSGAAALILALMLLGFQQYYLHGKAYPGRPIAPPIRTLVHLHAAAMTAWVVLFLIQPLLIATGNRRVHMVVGSFGAGLAACIVILGLSLGIQGREYTPPVVRIWGLTPGQFMMVPVATVSLFGLLVALGVMTRRRPDVHRPLMLMATLIAIPAAVSRIGPLNALYEGTVLQTIFGPFLWTLVLATLLLVAKCLTRRSLDRWSCARVWRPGRVFPVDLAGRHHGRLGPDRDTAALAGAGRCEMVFSLQTPLAGRAANGPACKSRGRRGCARRGPDLSPASSMSRSITPEHAAKQRELRGRRAGPLQPRVRRPRALRRGLHPLLHAGAVVSRLQLHGQAKSPRSQSGSVGRGCPTASGSRHTSSAGAPSRSTGR